MREFVLLFFFVLLFPLATQAKPSAFEAKVRRYERADRRQLPPKQGLLFVGSSSIEGWHSLRNDFPGALNRGMSGSRYSDLLYFAKRIILPYQPATIVLYSGDNDLAAGVSPEKVAGTVERLLRLIHLALPEARVFVLSVKPSLLRHSIIDKVRDVNARIERLVVSLSYAKYVDIYTPMLDERGEPNASLFRKDGLHMKAEGYALWTRVLSPLIIEKW